MASSDQIGPYMPLQPFTTAGGGQSKWTFAGRGGREYFLKEFLSPKYPADDAPMSDSTKQAKRERCRQFEERHLAVIAALRPRSGSGGNLVVATDFFLFRTKYYKVTERINIASVKPRDIAAFPVDDQLGVMLSATHSLRVLHGAGLVHGDVKPDNLLIKQDASGYVARVIDFDECFFVGRPPPPEDLVSTDVYHSPELMHYLAEDEPTPTVGTASDVFALGLVFVQYLTGELPGFPIGYGYPAQAVDDGCVPTILGAVAPGIGALVQSMLALKPDDRPTSDQVHGRLKDVLHKRETSATAVTAPVDKEGSRLKGALARRDEAGPVDTARDIGAPGSGGGSESRLRGRLARRAGG